MTAEQLQQLQIWAGLAAGLASAGVKSFHAIKALMADASVDDEIIAALAPQWDALVSDIARAAGR